MISYAQRIYKLECRQQQLEDELREVFKILGPEAKAKLPNSLRGRLERAQQPLNRFERDT